MASGLVGGALGLLGQSIFSKRKKEEDPNAKQLTTAPVADDTLARIEAERRLRREKGDSGRSGSILSSGTLG